MKKRTFSEAGCIETGEMRGIEMSTQKTLSVLSLITVITCVCTNAGAGIIQLDLFSLGCPTVFSSNSPSWQTDLNLGVTFSQISKVYINWSGTIVAEKVYPSATPETTLPVNGKFIVRLDGANANYISAGAATYPSPESFESQTQLNFESYVPNEIIVRFADGTITNAQRNAILASYGGGTIIGSSLLVPVLSLVLLPHDFTVEEVISALSSAPEILYAESNGLIYADGYYPPPWLELFDGQGNVEISFGKIYRSLDLCTADYPIGQLDSATLVIEGTIIPEPTSILFLAIGIFSTRAFKK